MYIKQPIQCIAAVACAWFAGSTFANTTRIVGGQPIVIDSAPSIVALLNASVLASPGRSHFDAQFCAGTLIADTWVLTAAHCVVSFDTVSAPSDIKIIANTDDLLNPVGEDLDVIEIIVAENYISSANGNDLALLRLDAPVSASIAPLHERELVEGELVTAAGWGATVFTFETGSIQFPTQLNAVDLLAQPSDICNTVSVYAGKIDETMVCAGVPEGGRDSCQGDSGGPLYSLQSDGQQAIAGITSFGVGCALEGIPGVYTNVTIFADWIRSVMLDTSTNSAADQEPMPSAEESEPSEAPADIPVLISTADSAEVDATDDDVVASSFSAEGGGSAGGALMVMLAVAGWYRRRQTHQTPAAVKRSCIKGLLMRARQIGFR